MTTSSRTPEGSPNRCPVCGNAVSITPSEPSGDATCPHCGSLIWFIVTDAGPLYYTKLDFVSDDAADLSAMLTERMKFAREQKGDEPREPRDVSIGDHVRIIDGYFKNFEGEVEWVDQASNQVAIRINIFGRATPVELPSWLVEKIPA